MSELLDIACSKLKQNRPKLPDTMNYTVMSERNDSRSFAAIWFRTVGCRFNHTGGCTMCDYWISNPISAEEMIKSVQDAISKISFEPQMLIINVSGSFFDELEVPREVRRKIYEILSKFKKTIFVFETHANTINDQTLNECLSYFTPNQINVEIGLETASSWIRKYCCNKKIENLNVVNAIKCICEHKINAIANIMIGIPFLSTKEAINDAVESIDWAFKNGVDRCVLFPINIKPWTLAYWMEASGLYRQPSLWALVEVLLRIDSTYLHKTELSWYKKHPHQHPLYEFPIQRPYTCDKCYPVVTELLDKYFLGDVDRRLILLELQSVSCKCKDDFLKQNEISPQDTLEERLKVIYEKIGVGILGNEWWQDNGKLVLTNISPLLSTNGN